MAETRGIIFHASDPPSMLAAKLNELVRWLTTDPKLGELRVGDEAKWEHDGKVTVTAFKMAAGATADHVFTSDASGNGTWQPPGSATPGRQRISGGSTGMGKTGDTYLAMDGVITSALDGAPLARAGKIVSIYAMANIASYSGAVALDAEVRINGAADTDYSRLTVTGTGWTVWGKTIAAASAASYSAGDFMALQIDKSGAGTVSYGNVLMAVEVQPDS